MLDPDPQLDDSRTSGVLASLGKRKYNLNEETEKEENGKLKFFPSLFILFPPLEPFCTSVVFLKHSCASQGIVSLRRERLC